LRLYIDGDKSTGIRLLAVLERNTMDAVAVNVVVNDLVAAETMPSEPWSKRVRQESRRD
jgi:hypothetical protein